MSAGFQVPEAAPPAAELVAATKRYRSGVMALGGLSLTLRQGEVVALLGPNGAGKSTAIKLLMGLASPTDGQARIFGQDPRRNSNRLRTGVMLQVGKAPETLRVREHIDLFRGYYPAPLPLAELVRLAGLSGLEDRMFGQLSGGERQRVMFALALAGDPDLVFLDEPTAGLDIEARRILWAEIRGLAARGKTVLLTTHYLEEADALASRIIVINKGKLVCEGTPTQVKAHAAQGQREIAVEPLPRPDAEDVAFSARVVANAASNADPRPASAAELPDQPVKIIRCSTSLRRDHLMLIPGVITVAHPPRELGSDEWLPTAVTTTHPEATLREMLALDPRLSQLEVTSPALEDAFLALTKSSAR